MNYVKTFCDIYDFLKKLTIVPPGNVIIKFTIYFLGKVFQFDEL